MTVIPLPSRAGIPLLGGFAPAMSAIESCTRGLSAKVAPSGIRVLGLRPDEMSDSRTIREVFGLQAKANGRGATRVYACGRNGACMLTRASCRWTSTSPTRARSSAWHGSSAPLSIGDVLRHPRESRQW